MTALHESIVRLRTAARIFREADSSGVGPRLPCGHFYTVGCAAEWYARARHCPTLCDAGCHGERCTAVVLGESP